MFCAMSMSILNINTSLVSQSSGATQMEWYRFRRNLAAASSDLTA